MSSRHCRGTISTKDHNTGEGAEAPSPEQEEQPWSVFHSTSGPLVNGFFVIEYTLPETEDEHIRVQNSGADGEGGEVRA